MKDLLKNSIVFEVITGVNEWVSLNLNGVHIYDIDKKNLSKEALTLLDPLIDEPELEIDYGFKNICDNGHDPIKHNERDCPLCELEREKDREIENKEDEIKELTEQLEPIEALAEYIKPNLMADQIKIERIAKIWELIDLDTIEAFEKYGRVRI